MAKKRKAKSPKKSVKRRAGGKTGKKSSKGKKKAAKKTAKRAAKKRGVKKAAKKKPAKKKATKKKTAKKKVAKKKAAKKKSVKKKAAKRKVAKKKPAKKAAKKKIAKKTPKKKTAKSAKKAAPKTAVRGKSAKSKGQKQEEKPAKVKTRGGYEVPPQVSNQKLTAAEMRELKGYLEGEKDRLIEEIANLTGQNFESIGGQRANRFANHLADVASDNQLVETLLVQSGMETDRLGFINEALERIRIKKYGICERCGAHIGYARLVAKPFARFCIVCREVLEKDTKRRF